MPPAFVLSQDQTLMLISKSPNPTEVRPENQELKSPSVYNKRLHSPQSNPHTSSRQCINPIRGRAYKGLHRQTGHTTKTSRRPRIPSNLYYNVKERRRPQTPINPGNPALRAERPDPHPLDGSEANHCNEGSPAKQATMAERPASATVISTGKASAELSTAKKPYGATSWPATYGML
jgi:hypothetical protein